MRRVISMSIEKIEYEYCAGKTTRVRVGYSKIGTRVHIKIG